MIALCRTSPTACLCVLALTLLGLSAGTASADGPTPLVQDRSVEPQPAQAVEPITAKDAAKPAPPARRANAPVHVWFCTHSAGFRHEVLPEARTTLVELGKASGKFEVDATDEISAFSPDLLARTHVVALYTTGALPIDAGLLKGWVERGGVLVGIHSATDTLAEDKAYVELIGGTFDGHPWNEEVTIRVDSPYHAAGMAFFEGDAPMRHPLTFRLADEIYQFKNLNPKNKVILSLMPGQAKMEKEREYPLAWTRDVGEGRVFYTALGHRPEVWRDAGFRRHLSEAIRVSTQDTGGRLCETCGVVMKRLPISYGLRIAPMDPRLGIDAGCVVSADSPRFGYRCFACEKVDEKAPERPRDGT